MEAHPADPWRTKSDAVSGDGFVGLLTGDVVGVDHDRDVQGAEVVIDEGFDGSPVESADAGGESGQGDAGERFLFRELVEGAEGVVDVFDAGLAWVAAGLCGGFLGEEIDDAEAAGAAPRPEAAGFRVLLMEEVAEVLVEGGPLFAEGEGETGMEIVIGGHAVGDDLGIGEEDIAGDFMDHREGWLLSMLRGDSPVLAGSVEAAGWATHRFRYAARNLAGGR